MRGVALCRKRDTQPHRDQMWLQCITKKLCFSIQETGIGYRFVYQTSCSARTEWGPWTPDATGINQSILPSERQLAFLIAWDRQIYQQADCLSFIKSKIKNLCKWGVFLSLNSLVEVTVNKTSVESTKGAAHEMGVHVAGAAQKLVVKVILNTPSLPQTVRWPQQGHLEKKERTGGLKIFQDPAAFGMLQTQPSLLPAPCNSTPQEAWQNGRGMQSSVTFFTHCLGWLLAQAIGACNHACTDCFSLCHCFCFPCLLGSPFPPNKRSGPRRLLRQVATEIGSMFQTAL